MSDDAPKPCVACKRTDRDPREYEIAPGRKVALCSLERSSSSHNYWSHDHIRRECRARAFIEGEFCPGCGEENISVGRICFACRDKLDLAKARAVEDAQLGWYTIHVEQMMPYIGDYDLRRDFGRALARAMAGRGRYRNSSYDVPGRTTEHLPSRYDDQNAPAAELTKQQAKAFVEFAKLFRDVCARQREEGQREGDDVLRQIMGGKMTVDEITDAQVALKKKARMKGGNE